MISGDSVDVGYGMLVNLKVSVHIHYYTVSIYTAKPLNKGDLYKLKCFVLCREVVLFSEVQNVLEL